MKKKILAFALMGLVWFVVAALQLGFIYLVFRALRKYIWGF